MRKRTSVMVMAGSLVALGLALAPAASAGNVDYGISMTKLSNGKLWTTIRPDNVHEGSWWTMSETYEKTGGGTITAKLGFNYHGYSYDKGWFSQSAGTDHSEGFDWLGFDDCNDIVGWMAVQGQGTFYNAPVSICDGSR
ncbi:hypothetical protein EDE04_4766 [Streptomyces sp. 2132.2]|uniref:hypothetical protein n=1 Tax=Streptomyces sp. 2132.2 TaxID=2485161 RepID=UPI000F960D71|nr:hypothetical protein [Streptomyces sp. 2132.2]ROQ98238.1 hypothetical protein EDE04_4766 [Streptomyces sp. 2132.2]